MPGVGVCRCVGGGAGTLTPVFTYILEYIFGQSVDLLTPPHVGAVFVLAG